MPIAHRTVLVDMGERSSPQGIGQLARALLANGIVNRAVACQMPQSRAAMHLDTVVVVIESAHLLKSPIK